jgi:hypothetical protein
MPNFVWHPWHSWHSWPNGRRLIVEFCRVLPSLNKPVAVLLINTTGVKTVKTGRGLSKLEARGAQATGSGEGSDMRNGGGRMFRFDIPGAVLPIEKLLSKLTVCAKGEVPGTLACSNVLAIRLPMKL